MKKLFLAATALLWASVFFNPAGAQMLALKENVNPGTGNHYAASDWIFESVYDSRKVELNNPKIINHFTKNFSDIAHVKWYIVENGMIAKFKKDNLPYAISYSSEGSWKHTVKYYAGSYVPSDVREKINKRFKGFHILRAREFLLPGQPFPVYLVQIQKDDQAKIVRTSKAGTAVVERIHLLHTEDLSQ